MQLRRTSSPSPRSSFIPFSLAFSFLLGPAVALADLEKEKVKEKEEKEALPALDGEEHAREHQSLLKKGEENLKEINRLLDEIQNNLSQKNTGAGTQEKQAAAVKRMEELIHELAKG